jgi:4'-phosphopantetheinyl transferase
MSEAFPPSELPPETAIEVWAIDLDRPLDPGVDLDRVLSSDEINRACRFAFEQDARRFRMCRAMLRLGLGWYLQKNPKEIQLTTGAWGKPSLADGSELNFNVTHSEGLGLIAFTTAAAVGVDVEAVDRVVDDVDIESSFFTRNEAAIISSGTTPQEQSNTFLRFWTRKEAVLKAAGYGIARGLYLFDVSRIPASGVTLSDAKGNIDGTGWMVKDLQPINGFIGAIAAPLGDWSIQHWQVSFEDAFDRAFRGSAGIF